MVGSECHDLIALAQQKRIGLNHERSAALLNDGSEGFVEIIPGRGFDNKQLLSQRVGSRLHIARVEFRNGVVGIYKKSITSACGTSPCNISNCFATSTLPKDATPVTF